MRKSVLVFGAAVVFGVCIAAGAAGLPDVQKIIPADTIFLISAPDFNSLQAGWEKTSYYKFYKDPAMAGFVNDLRDKWTRKIFSDVDSKEFADLIKDINSLPSGKVAFAAIAGEKAKQGKGDVEALAIIQWGSQIAKVKTAVEKHVSRMVESGKSKKSKEQFKSYDIITVETKGEPAEKEIPIEIQPDGNSGVKEFAYAERLAEDDDSANEFTIPGRPEENEPAVEIAEPKEADKTSYAIVGDTLLLGDNAEMVKFMISHIEGATGSTLAEAGRCSAILAGLGPVHDIDVYLNVPALLGIAMASDTSGQAKMQFANFGLDNVGDIGLSVAVGRTAGVGVSMKGLFKVSGEKKGLIKLIEPVNGPVKLPKFINASAAKISVFNFNFAAAYEELFKLLNNISPGAAAMLNTPLVPANQEGQGGVTLKKDVIDHLGIGAVAAETIVKPFKTVNESSKMIFGIATTDSKSLEKSLSLLHNQFIGQGKGDVKREFMGYTIYSLGNMSMLPMFGGRGPMAAVDKEAPAGVKEDKIAFAVIPEYMLIGSESNIEEAIRLINNKEASGIENAQWLVRARKALPEKVGLASLSNDQAAMEYLWWLVKEGKVGEADMQSMLIADMVKDYADFKLLPDFGTIKKYFGVSSSYVISRQDGFYFEGQALETK